jgi:hypothetical protein
MSNLLQRIALVAAVIGMPAPASAQTTDSTPEARQQMQAYGACVADRSAAKASQTLSSDFRTQKYHLAMRALNDNNRDCSRLLPRRSKLYSSSLLFAGAMAERLMAAGPRPLNVRLAEAAARPAPTFYSQSDAIAMCVVRSAPDETARLFSSDVGSAAEIAAARALDVAVKLCSRGGPELHVNLEGLRAMLATAAFRNVASLTLAKKS